MSTDEAVPQDTLDLVREVCPRVRDTGWLFYFTPHTQARAEELGLDVFTLYVIGRGGVLGDVEWPVVHSAFGYFHPDFIKGAWERGRVHVAPRDAGRAFIECSHEFGREKLAEVGGLEDFCAAAGAVNDAAQVHSAGLSLYSAASSEPLADDLPARAMQLLTLLREYRGSAHLLAVVASGLTPVEAHYLGRPERFALFGWSESDTPEVGDDHRARLQTAEELTDRIVSPAYGVLDETARKGLVDGMIAVEAALT
jgi:hypothetical protein